MGCVNAARTDRDAVNLGQHVTALERDLSTLAISGLTPKEAESIAAANGQSTANTNGTNPTGDAGNPAKLRSVLIHPIVMIMAGHRPIV